MLVEEEMQPPRVAYYLSHIKTVRTVPLVSLITEEQEKPAVGREQILYLKPANWKTPE